MRLNSKFKIRNSKLRKLVPLFLEWFSQNARHLPWRRTNDPYAIWVSEIMLQQTQVKTVIPFWNRWMRELPTIEAAAKASPAKIHKLWEGLGYYTRVRNLQKAAKQIMQSGKRNPPSLRSGATGAKCGKFVCRFLENFDDVLALPGIGRYTAGAICSIAFNQPTPILDGNAIRVLTRVFDIRRNPKEKKTNALLWKLAEELVITAGAHPFPRRSRRKEAPTSKSEIGNRESEIGQSLLTSAATTTGNCSALNQSLMELGARICTPRNPRCLLCPINKLCVAYRTNRVVALPNLGQRAAATARRFVAFVIGQNGKFLVRRRPAGVVNAHLWEFPNVEIHGRQTGAHDLFQSEFRFAAPNFTPLATVKHSITRYRITLEAFVVRPERIPAEIGGRWATTAQMQRLPFTSAHRKILRALIASNVHPH
jgi:A/G-specific adenine glycosylase